MPLKPRDRKSRRDVNGSDASEDFAFAEDGVW
jgi:hypothetical protein